MDRKEERRWLTVNRRGALFVAGLVSVASLLAAYVTIRYYGHAVLLWRHGSVAVGWGPFQVFAARASMVPNGSSSVSTQIGLGIVLDPAALGFAAYYLLRRHGVRERQPLA